MFALTDEFPEVDDHEPLLLKSPKGDKSKLQHSKSFFSVVVLTFLMVGVFSTLVWYQQAFGPQNVIRFESNWKALETKAMIQSGWEWEAHCKPDEMITLTFTLELANTDKLDALVREVSDVDSDKYGAFWTADQLHAYFSPKTESLQMIQDWFNYHGITSDHVIFKSYNQGLMKVKMTAGLANRMLNTEFGYWINKITKEKHLRVKEEYFIPAELFPHLAFISPTYRFPLAMNHIIEVHGGSPIELTENDITGDGWGKKHKTHGRMVMPGTIEKQYRMNNFNMRLGSSNDENGNARNNKQAIASFLQQYYNDADLHRFFHKFRLKSTRTERFPKDQDSGFGKEAQLDIEYLTTTGNGIDTLALYTDKDGMFQTIAVMILDNFADNPPYVLSISYGGDEIGLTPEYMDSTNNYFGQLALMGITIFASAGDAGATGMFHECIFGKYMPSFPATSPYVTSVGATQFKGKSNVEETWVKSGGGFSTYFDRPTWQAGAVNKYLSNNKNHLPPSKRFKKSGRGYPDISALGSHYVIALKGKYYLVSGTSCSAPTVAGMISTINGYRMALGKKPLGFLNPLLYKMYEKQQNPDNPQYFTDVVDGHNLGCIQDSKKAFKASVGWDPITGVGTPRFDEMAKFLITVK